jgi:hypothetical protein
MNYDRFGQIAEWSGYPAVEFTDHEIAPAVYVACQGFAEPRVVAPESRNVLHGALPRLNIAHRSHEPRNSRQTGGRGFGAL